MPSAREHRPEILTAAHGAEHLTDQDREVLLGLLGKFGLSGSFTAIDSQDISAQEETHRKIWQSPELAFESLKLPGHIILREHVEDFVNKGEYDNPKPTATRVFRSLVDGNAPRYYGSNGARKLLFEWQPKRLSAKGWVQTREPVAYEGIQVVKREEYGFSAYLGRLSTYDNVVCAQYGLVAGSVVDALHDSDLLLKAKTKSTSIIGDLVGQLAQQLPRRPKNVSN